MADTTTKAAEHQLTRIFGDENTWLIARRNRLRFNRMNQDP